MNMHKKISVCASLCLMVVFSVSASMIMKGPVKKKFIACGFEFGSASASNLLANAAAYEGLGLDGTMIGLTGPMPDGKDATVYMTTRDMREWPLDVFAAEVPLLKELTSTTAFRGLFVRSFRIPRKRVAWDDDKSWSIIAGHMRAIAWAAKRGGCRGLHIDHEDYFKCSQFVRLKDELPWDELAKVARRRGRETFKAAFDEFPDAELFFYRFLVADPSFWNSYSTADDPVAAMRAKGDLWIPFINGMLDVMPWTVKLIEGDETGYRYESKYNWFHFARTLQAKCTQMFVDTKHLDKYRSRLSSSFPVYLDSYTDDSFAPGSQYYRDPVEGSRAAHLERNLAQASDASDEYVWLYGEKRTWIKRPEKLDARLVDDGRTWTDMFPGLSDVLNANRDPAGFLKRCLADTGKFEDAFKGEYSFWKRGGKKGAGVFEKDDSFGRGDASSYRAKGVKEGCFLCEVPAKCGEYFAVTFSVKNGSTEWARAGYASNEDDLNSWLIPGHAIPLSAPDADGWRSGAVLMRASDFSKAVNFNAGVSLAESESAWLDDVHFYRVIPLLKDGFAPKAGKR